MNTLSIFWKSNKYVHCDCIQSEMKGGLVDRFGGEIPRVPSAVIKNTCLTVYFVLLGYYQIFKSGLSG